MRSRCLMVLGVPRSGSSCVAGVLHQLGVDMGAGHFQPKDWANPKGYFEDMRWRHTTQRITGRGYSLKAASLEGIGATQRKMYRLLARSCAQKRLWGMKDPWLCFVGYFIWWQLKLEGVSVRLIVTERSREASISSVQKHLNRTYKGKGDAENIIDTWQAGLDKHLEAWKGNVLTVNFDELTRDPVENIQHIADFAFEGIGRPPGDMVKIARWVNSDLNHHEGET